jgi:2-keto-4-pentenoate hydratase/2-oxohepta-3-ene-1,7-dioic acid hydratase in catechol pathway
MAPLPKPSLTNFIAYRKNGQLRVGHLDQESRLITPLSFASGSPVRNLYQVIEAGADSLIAGGEELPFESIELQAPFSSRDVLAIGRNYAEHSKEFNDSVRAFRLDTRARHDG